MNDSVQYDDEQKEINDLLSELHDFPRHSEALEPYLAKFVSYLDHVKHRGLGGFVHWFCDEAHPTTVETATFLLQLHAYNSPAVAVWKDDLKEKLHGCFKCARGCQEAKIRLRTFYLHAFPQESLDNFFRTIDEWEAGVLLDAFQSAGFGPNSETSRRHLDSASPYLLFHMMSNTNLLKHPSMESLLKRFPLRSRIAAFPKEPPVGVLLLLFHEDDQVRGWAGLQARDTSPIALNDFNAGVSAMMQTVVQQIDGNSGLWAAKLSPSSVVLWTGLHRILRLLSPDAIKDGLFRIPGVDFPHLITRHLHDKEAHFPYVLRCFVHLLRVVGSHFWSFDSPDFPEVVYDSIKDNPGFEQLLREGGRSHDEPWFLTSFQVFLQSVWALPIFDDALAKVINFMGEELQHPRFEPPTRALVMRVVLSTMSFVHGQARKGSDPKRRASIMAVFAIQASNIASVAFGKQYRDDIWSEARKTARSLLKGVFKADTDDLGQAVIKICRVGKALAALKRRSRDQRDISKEDAREEAMTALSDMETMAVNSSIWQAVQTVASKNDEDCMAFLMHAIAPTVHIDILDMSTGFKPRAVSDDPVVQKKWISVVESLNAALSSIRYDFDSMMESFAGSVDAGMVARLLSDEEFIHDIFRLILCQLESVSPAAQAIVGEICESPERSECFRVLLLNCPVASLDGICSYIATFKICAEEYPEACRTARWLVRCLADVVEVLCRSGDGLLTQSEFLKKVADPNRIYTLWGWMCKASTLIFKHIPDWSEFYETQVMTEWMRDAVIFVRDLLAHVRTFEYACNGDSLNANFKAGGASPHKLSSAGKRMVGCLDSVLENVVKWLRLTDVELLHQSTELLLALLDRYRRSNVTPPEKAIEGINTRIINTRTKPDSRGKLTNDQLAELEAAIAPFLPPDSDVEVLEPDDEVTYLKTSPARPRTTGNVSDVSSRESSAPLATMKPSTSTSESKERFRNVFQQIQPPLVKGFKQSSSGSSGSAFSKSTLQSAAYKRDSTGFGRPPQKPQRPQPSNSLMAKVRNSVPVTRPADFPKRKRHLHPKNEGGRIEASSVDISKSSSESDEEEGTSEDEGGLAAIAKLQRSPDKVRKPPPPPPERRQVKRFDEPTMAKNPALERINQRQNAINNQLRLKPDLGPFTRQVLMWDYNAVGATPPYPPHQQRHLAHLPSSFASHEEYKRAFEPLLMVECWQQVVKSKEEPEQPLLCDIAGRAFVDDWLDLDVSISPEGAPRGWFLQDTDVMLLRQIGGDKSILSKVQSFRRKDRGPAMHFEASLRCCLAYDSQGMNGALQIRSKWRAHKVFSLSTIYREYAALQGLPYYDLFQDIIHPQPARLPEIPAQDVKRAMVSYQVNEPQAKAILGSLDTNGFALIQGPPGTGKTKTICGLVGRWLSTRRSAGKQKILVCAPSNAAIDEVARRLKEGVFSDVGKRVIPNVVRIGADAVINISVKDISLDELVDRRINQEPSVGGKSDAYGDIGALQRERDLLHTQRQTKENELAGVRDNVARVTVLETEIKNLKAKGMALTQKINQAKDKQRDAGRALDAARRRFRQEVLDGADVICCTLSGAGSDILGQFDFETVIIDEAAQSVELSSLIPLKYRCKRCILVGDPQQLPPTVLSQLADDHGYSRSLFVRIMKQRPEAVHLLSIQYRMNPEISILSSSLFYDSKLLDGPNMSEKTTQPWHASSVFRPYRFFDVFEGTENKAQMGHSLVNSSEANTALALYERLKGDFKAVDFDYRVGIVSMYKEQVFNLKRVFRARYGEEILSTVDFNTVDGFQGQEKDIIILSCVRAGPGLDKVGFLADRRRTNVAITRARSSLFILGNAATLERSDPVWKHVVQDARQRDLLLKCNAATFRSSQPLGELVPIPQKPVPRRTAEPPVPRPLPELLTPREMAARQEALRRPAQKKDSPSDGSASLSAVKPVIASQDVQPEKPLPAGVARKRKNSEEGPRLEPPALRAPASNAPQPSAAAAPPRPSIPSGQGNGVGMGARPSGAGSSMPASRPHIIMPPRAPVAPASETMFIPKKKRPAPPDPSVARPSNAKQRITADIQQKSAR